MPCTVIRPGDMADNILDRDKHPEWNGERTKMVYAFPTNEKLWQQYAEIRAEGLRKRPRDERGDRVLPRRTASEMDAARGRLAGAVQPRRAVGPPARHEPEAARTRRPSSPSTRTSRCRTRSQRRRRAAHRRPDRRQDQPATQRGRGADRRAST